MKVIKEGKKIEGIMRVTCKTCDAVLEIQAGDLTKDRCGQFDTPVYFYKCPCCRRSTYLSFDDLSEEIRFDLTN